MSRRTRYLAFASIGMAIILSSGLSAFGQGGQAQGGQGGQGGEGGRGGQGTRAKLPEAPSIGFFGSYRVAADKIDPSKLPIIGAWRMNFEKSDPSLKIQGRFKETATTIFTAVNGGILHQIFNFYPPENDSYKTVYTPNAREYWFKLDGKNINENPEGPNGSGQTAGLWLIDRNTLYRERATKGVVDERTLYRVSPDGNTLVWTRFGDAGDSSHFVWDRINLPPR